MKSFSNVLRRCYVKGFIYSFLIVMFGFWWWGMLPQPLFDTSFSTVLLDRNDEVLGIMVADDEQLRFEEINQLPYKYVASVLAYEDRRFVLHNGIDPVSLSRALFQNISAGRIVSGGSTISMQVVRLLRKNPPRTFKEKLYEILLTLRLEQGYTKWEILCMYASHAPFGGNVVGMRAASVKYFDRQPEHLSWAEAALLAVLPNAPSLIFPGKNNHLLKRKRDELLKKLHGYGLLAEDDYKLALAEPLPREMYNIPSVAPHLLSRAFSEKKGEVCRSFIDARLQKRVSDILERHVSMLSHNYIYNAAVLVAHIPSGEVRAYVGNSQPRSGSRGNHVDIIRSVRSSGSILKPALYGLMQQNGFILPKTLVPDIPSRFGSYSPSNFSKDFKGVVPANKALAQSLNIPFVRMLRDYTYARFYDDLKQLGINSLNRDADNYGLSLILGGAETSLWDVCNMYAGMSSVLYHYNQHDGQYYGGEYSRLELWKKASGNDEQFMEQPVLQKTKAPLHASAIWLTLKAMEDVDRPDIEKGWKNFVSSMNLSWKTGTSFGFRDAWAVGVNPEYVIGVWVGNADGEGRPGLVGVRVAAPILFEVAGLLRTNNRFTEPEEEMAEVVVCRKSGFKASVFCDETDTIRACEMGSQVALCPYHRLINLDATGKWRVTASCEPVHKMKVVPWFVLTPTQEWYYSRVQPGYKKLPPYRHGCQPEREDMMEMIYPQRGTRVFLPRDFDGKESASVFEAAHRNPSAEIYWYVDDEYMGSTCSIHQMTLLLKEGRYRLTLMDEDGNMLQQRFTVVGMNE